MNLPQLKSALMISIGWLYDNDCNVLLNKNKLYVFKQSKLILEGTMNTSDGLSDVPIQKQKMTNKNYVLPVAHLSMYKNRTHKEQHTTLLKHTTKPKSTMHSSNEDKKIPYWLCKSQAFG